MSNENSSTNKPSSSREYEVICFTNNELHRSTINTLLADRRCVGVLHDRDKEDDGSIKSPHYHILIRFDKPTTIGSVEKIIPNHPSNLIQFVKSFKGACRYLLHLDNPEKAQYTIDELVGNVQIAKRHCRTDDIEEVEILKIVDYIHSKKEYLLYYEVLQWCCEEHLYSTYRRNAYTINKIIDQKNTYAINQTSKKDKEDYIDEL